MSRFTRSQAIQPGNPGLCLVAPTTTRGKPRPSQASVQQDYGSLDTSTSVDPASEPLPSANSDLFNEWINYPNNDISQDELSMGAAIEPNDALLANNSGSTFSEQPTGHENIASLPSVNENQPQPDTQAVADFPNTSPPCSLKNPSAETSSTESIKVTTEQHSGCSSVPSAPSALDAGSVELHSSVQAQGYEQGSQAGSNTETPHTSTIVPAAAAVSGTDLTTLGASYSPSVVLGGGVPSTTSATSTPSSRDCPTSSLDLTLALSFRNLTNARSLNWWDPSYTGIYAPLSGVTDNTSTTTSAPSITSPQDRHSASASSPSSASQQQAQQQPPTLRDPCSTPTPLKQDPVADRLKQRGEQAAPMVDQSSQSPAMAEHASAQPKPRAEPNFQAPCLPSSQHRDQVPSTAPRKEGPMITSQQAAMAQPEISESVESGSFSNHQGSQNSTGLPLQPHSSSAVHLLTPTQSISPLQSSMDQPTSNNSRLPSPVYSPSQAQHEVHDMSLNSASSQDMPLQQSHVPIHTPTPSISYTSLSNTSDSVPPVLAHSQVESIDEHAGALNGQHRVASETYNSNAQTGTHSSTQPQSPLGSPTHSQAQEPAQGQPATKPVTTHNSNGNQVPKASSSGGVKFCRTEDGQVYCLDDRDGPVRAYLVTDPNVVLAVPRVAHTSPPSPTSGASNPLPRLGTSSSLNHASNQTASKEFSKAPRKPFDLKEPPRPKNRKPKAAKRQPGSDVSKASYRPSPLRQVQHAYSAPTLFAPIPDISPAASSSSSTGAPLHSGSANLTPTSWNDPSSSSASSIHSYNSQAAALARAHGYEYNPLPIATPTTAPCTPVPSPGSSMLGYAAPQAIVPAPVPVPSGSSGNSWSYPTSSGAHVHSTPSPALVRKRKKRAENETNQTDVDHEPLSSKGKRLRRE
ncbi:unnamed protein product [Rhizoctonia solani]|uniref:Uncharacterized protein n=1 Tax=Rhizoctonia solani TaxID=456999 RepID=A0A8H2WJH6_9AGAM|nr:unnamed protein product [Rhizoctonia solani]